MKRKQPGKPLVWVDIGGGTGWNIEQMAEYFPLEELSQIYLIDLCEPLLGVARKRFQARALRNVQVLCQDAQEFVLPGIKEGKMVNLFTCSYSISMVRESSPVLKQREESSSQMPHLPLPPDTFLLCGSRPNQRLSRPRNRHLWSRRLLCVRQDASRQAERHGWR